MVSQVEIILPAMPKGYHLITTRIAEKLPKLPKSGLLHLFIKHTSAGLSINENADPSVRIDFEIFMNSLVPEGFAKFSHTSEGCDDMPAHIKSALFGNALSIPITNSKMNLGTWQGIYLCEFRFNGGSRRVVATIIGE